MAQHGYSDTVEAMRRGEIHMSHAKVIARHSPEPHRRSEDSFLGLCRGLPSDTVSRHTLAYESNQVFADLAAEAAAKNLDPADAELALQRRRRRVSLRCGDDGMWDLRGRLDFMTGRRLNLALQAAIRSLRHRHDTQDAGARRADSAGQPGHGAGNSSNAGSDNGAAGRKGETRSDASAQAAPTTAQFAADALAQLMLGAPASQRTVTNLLIIADYDIVEDRLANPRLDDGTPISAQILADHATDANVLPAVFKADWSELALGRTRNASDAQRLVLAARDGGCIGCELASEHTEAHHIDHHEHGGLTDIHNLASLCRPCHTSVHQHHRRIHTPPDGKPRLQPPQPTDNDPPPPEPDSTTRPLPPEPTRSEPPALDDRVPAPARDP